MNTEFAKLALKAALLENVASLGYTTMTPIQAQGLPAILAGKDIIGQAKTGSGKTAAFGLGLLNKLDVKRFRIQALVLCPTRELADQVASDLRNLARQIHNIKILTLCGGSAFGPQVGSLEHGAHIIVGTPGRVDEHIRKGNLTLDNIETIVLDEADRMLDMGFQEAVDDILDAAPAQRQTLLFSATFPEGINKIAKRVMHNPSHIKIESDDGHKLISEHFYRVENNRARCDAVKRLLLHFAPQACVVFCSTKQATLDLTFDLASNGFSVAVLNGDLEQRERDQTLIQFANGSICVLVATDVAARGLDIDNLDAVINYDIAHDAEVHTHRVGRTGRAGKTGVACSIFMESEAHKVAVLETSSDPLRNPSVLPDSTVLSKQPVRPAYRTLHIQAGKKQKLRPGDIVGALTAGGRISGDQLGKIKIMPERSFVAVKNEQVATALQLLEQGKLKGRNVRVRKL